MKREEFTYQTNTGEFVAEKLLPCPFCGGEPEFVTIGNDYTKSRKAEIKCIKCFCKRTTGAIHNNLEWCGRKAIELWNKRTAEPPLPPAEGAEYNDGVSYGIHVCDAEFHALVQDTFEKFDRLGKINKSDVQSILGELDASSLGDNINPNLCFAEPQPTAEGAEEILASIVESLGEPINIHNHVFEIRPYTVEHKTEWWIFHKEVGSGEPLKQWLGKFAALHAQKIADKMVSEKLREELIKYEIHWNFVLRDNAEKVVDEYLKSREK